MLTTMLTTKLTALSLFTAGLLLAAPAPASAQAGASCFADTNGDQNVNVDDLVNVLLCWGSDGIGCPGPLTNSDVNGDGTVDVDDLVAVVLGWGACPDDTCHFDAFTTLANPDGSSNTYFDMGQDLPPIPADFFDPGSLPFEGRIELCGIGLDPQMPGVDTIIRRSDDFELGPGEGQTVDIQLVELDLAGCQPITVVTNGNANEWMVGVGIDPDQSGGQMDVVKTHPNGGVFEAEFFVQPIFTFARVDELQQLAQGILLPEDIDLRILDIGEMGFPPLPMSFDQAPWSHTPSVDQVFVWDSLCDFYPGIDPTGNGQDECLNARIPSPNQSGFNFCGADVGPPQGCEQYDLIGVRMWGGPGEQPFVQPHATLHVPCNGDGQASTAPPFIIRSAFTDTGNLVTSIYAKLDLGVAE